VALLHQCRGQGLADVPEGTREDDFHGAKLGGILVGVKDEMMEELG